ncbi:hypothetical protein D884_03193 [Pseudomonas sp. URMO17WK12:I10]|nr:hypothetical protein F633_03469 [Pseudomonas sp. LAMO17WK12:I3]RED05082.1 hypothetical protein D884_03193 [Pseudomonas sp. URMO17WK12:I10]SOD08468.1 hypothetical protein SAMN05660967_01677 [Pseudomonas sp. URMO17WK12:I9]
MEDANRDPEKQPLEFMRSNFLVTNLDFVRYMDAHFDSTECPQCKKDEGWMMDAESRRKDCTLPDGVEYMRVYRMTFADESEAFRPFFSLSCAACGSARHILCDNVMNWLASQTESAD